MFSLYEKHTPLGIHPALERNLLVVDDDEANRDAITELFRYQFEVRSATTGRQAILLSELLVPTVTILDVRLPVLDGYQVCRRLRAKGLRSLIVMMSAERNVQLASLANEVGADNFFSKPFELSKLFNLVMGAVSTPTSSGATSQ